MAKAAKIAAPRLPKPGYFAIITGVLCALVLPAIPMYIFEKEALASIEGKGWIRVTNVTRAGDLLTPITLIKTPISSLTAVSPEMLQQDSYQRVQFIYDEEPRVTSLTVWCSDKEIWIAEADWEDTLRYTDQRPMREDESEIFCESDWSRERDALYEEFQKKSKVAMPTASSP